MAVLLGGNAEWFGSRLAEWSASRLQARDIQNAALGGELGCSQAMLLQEAHHLPSVTRIRRQGDEHVIVGASWRAGQCPSNGVLDMKVAYGQRVGIAMRHSNCNCSGPHADSGQLHECTASIRPGKLGGALNEMRMTRNGDERSRSLSLDAKAMKLP